MIDFELAHDLIELTYGPVTPLLSKALRAQFIAARSRLLYGGDFSNIEGRLNAWFAGEDWKLEAFRAYDRGEGEDLYKVTASRVLGIPSTEIKKPQRQSFGKTPELACGYQGSIGAWLRFDPKPSTVVKVVLDQFRYTDAWKKAASQYDRARDHFGLTADQWIAVKIVVNGWRESNARIVQSWWDYQDAALQAVDQPGTRVEVLGGKVAYFVDSGFLWCRLPSGKMLAYATPRIVEMKEEYLVDAEGNSFPVDEFFSAELEAKLAEGATIEKGPTRLQVSFLGKHGRRQVLYGGLQCNNIVQGTAREILRFAMHRVEDAGYPIVLHVHDETVSEVDERFGSVQEYEALMSLCPPWLPNFPLAAKAWSHKRYVK